MHPIKFIILPYSVLIYAILKFFDVKDEFQLVSQRCYTCHMQTKQKLSAEYEFSKRADSRKSELGLRAMDYADQL